MAVNSGPVQSTGPTSKSPTTLAALRQRIENAEQAINRLQANRNPQTFQVHQLTNAKPMSKVADGQSLIYDAVSGQYKPGATGYASLTGTGETSAPGLLTQFGGLIIQNDSAATIASFDGTNIDLAPGGTENLNIGTGSTHSTFLTFTDTAGINIFSDGGMDWQSASGGGAFGISSAGFGAGGGTGGALISLADSSTKIAALGADGGGSDVRIGDGSGKLHFFSTAAGVVKPNVTGSKGGNAALGSLMTALAALGLVTDSTT